MSLSPDEVRHVAGLARLALTDDEVAAIDEHAVEAGINIWEPSTPQL